MTMHRSFPTAMSRRGLLRQMMLGSLALAGGCARHVPESSPLQVAQPLPSPLALPRLPATPRPAVSGSDVMIDLHHHDLVRDFSLARQQSGILAIMHKASEGVGWSDRLYGQRREDALNAGLLWGAYHFGTRQYSGGEQAAAFLAAAQPQPGTLLALDLEMNENNPANSMKLSQAEDFVRAVWAATGRLPLVYVSPNWANGVKARRHSLDRPIGRDSILAACDLWLADYRQSCQIPVAWADRGWRFWQYTGDCPTPGPYADALRGVSGVDQCDRNLFAGDHQQLARYWHGMQI